jgi:(p)ppGpp synthase/HD superfamily hydrolase
MSNNHLYSDRILRAMSLAAECNQRRMSVEGDWYLGHELQVASLLMEIRATENEVIAGLFHDVVYMGAMPASSLASHFGPEVRLLVLGLTTGSPFDYEGRLMSHCRSLRSLPPDSSDFGFAASCIKIATADRTDRVRRYWLLYSQGSDDFLVRVGLTPADIIQRNTTYSRLIAETLDRLPAMKHLYIQFLCYLEAFSCLTR